VENFIFFRFFSAQVNSKNFYFHEQEKFSDLFFQKEDCVLKIKKSGVRFTSRRDDVP